MKDLLTLSHRLSKFVVGGEGNVSVKCQAGTFLIKSSGVQLHNLDETGLTLCDLSGIQLHAEQKKPSMEVGFHAWLQGLPNVKYVGHVHPVNLLKVLCSSDDIVDAYAGNRIFPDQVVFNGQEACVVPYVHPGKKLSMMVEKCVLSYMERLGCVPDVILLKNHGVICAGSTIEKVATSVEVAEKAAEIFMGLLTSGQQISFLNRDQIKELCIDPAELHRKGTST